MSSAWNAPVEKARHDEPIDILVAIPAVFLTARDAFSWLGISIAGQPTDTLAAAVLIVVAVFRHPRWRLHNPLLAWSAILLVAWLCFTTVVINDISNPRRIGNILILLLVATFIGSGRLGLRSLVAGGLVGYVGALGLSIVLMQTRGSNYAGRLTGVLGDPNAAGFILISLGLAFAQGIPEERGRRRWWVWLLAAGGVWLTQSRTSIFALLIATGWIILGRRMNRLWSLAFLVATVPAYQWAQERMMAQGWFADREGSDLLRQRLLLVEQQQAADAGWHGNGLGTAIADLDNITLFFHNNYLAMQAEGGRIALYLLYAMVAGLFLMIHRLPVDRRPVWAEAGVVAAFVCSINIGFSITHPAMAVAIGMLLLHHGIQRQLLVVGDEPKAVSQT